MEAPTPSSPRKGQVTEPHKDLDCNTLNFRFIFLTATGEAFIRQLSLVENRPWEENGAQTTPGDSKKTQSSSLRTTQLRELTNNGQDNRLPQEKPVQGSREGAELLSPKPWPGPWPTSGAHAARSAARLGTRRTATRARCAPPKAPPQRRQLPPAPVSHHVPGAQNNRAGPHMAAAAAAGTVEAVPAPLERHDGSTNLPRPNPPLALPSHFPPSRGP